MDNNEKSNIVMQKTGGKILCFFIMKSSPYILWNVQNVKDERYLKFLSYITSIDEEGENYHIKPSANCVLFCEELKKSSITSVIDDYLIV
jgi:hypothetical protein